MQPLDIDEVPDVGKSMLYERFAERLLAYVCQQVSNRQDAEDLLLEVFLAALQNTSLARLPAERQLAWLRREARNRVIDNYGHTGLFTIQPLRQAQKTEVLRGTLACLQTGGNILSVKRSATASSNTC